MRPIPPEADTLRVLGSAPPVSILAPDPLAGAADSHGLSWGSAAAPGRLTYLGVARPPGVLGSDGAGNDKTPGARKIKHRRCQSSAWPIEGFRV